MTVMTNIKAFILVLVLSMTTNTAIAQSYNQERTALENFLVRMYRNAPFEGVKIVSDYGNTYLLSVVSVKNNGNETAMNRVAQVKSQRQVSQYISGNVTTESQTIIRTSEDVKDNVTVEEVTDIIKEHSVGFTKSMEVLTTFETTSGTKCFMFYRKLDELK